MSHLPVGQVRSDTPNWPATKITQSVAHQTQRIMLSTYSANVNVTTTGAKTIFTTASGKGQFVPLQIASYCSAGNAPGGFGLAVSVGWNDTISYYDWVNQQGIEDITTGGFGAGNFQIPQNLPIQCNFDYPRSEPPAVTWYQGGIYVASAPPNTPVVVNVISADGAASDLRTFVITGFYTGA